MNNVGVNHLVLRTMMLAAIAAFALMPCVALAETYAHGYLRYEVEDGSVTITGYAGREETVTVPTMIGGYPVNAVASGAFSDAQSVVAVYLPDTVTSVEQGAFGVGQAVVFGERPESSGGASGAAGTADGATAGSDENGGNADGTGTTDGDPADSTEDGGSAGGTVDGGNTEGGNAPAASVPGIRLDDGSLVSVDSEGHLVLVDSSGTERVLDDTRVYSRVSKPDGTVSIADDAGNEVAVADGSKVSFSDAEGRQVAVDAARGSITTTSEDGTYSDEEADVDDEASDESESKSEDGQERAGNPAAVVAVIVVVVLAVVGVVFWRRKSAKAGE